MFQGRYFWKAGELLKTRANFDRKDIETEVNVSDLDLYEASLIIYRPIRSYNSESSGPCEKLQCKRARLNPTQDRAQGFRQRAMTVAQTVLSI